MLVEQGGNDYRGNVVLNTSHFQTNCSKPRTMGTFLVPIGAMIFFSVFISQLLRLLGLTPADNKFIAELIAIRWGRLLFYPLGIFISLAVKIVTLTIIFAVLYKNEKMRPKDFGFSWSLGQGGWKQVLYLNVKVTVTMFFLFVFILNIFYNFLNPEFVDDTLNYFNSMYHVKNVNFNFFAPPFEEIIFRGIYCTLLVRCGLKWRYTILATGVLFGLIHLFNSYSSPMMYVSQIIGITIVGWFLGWIFYKTRTVMVPIFWHYAFNIVFCFFTLRMDLLSKIVSHLII